MDMDLKDTIREVAQQFNLPPDLVYGICMKESGMDSKAVRYEPGYKWTIDPRKVRGKPALCSSLTEIQLQKMSYGLMQVMGAVLREHGYMGWLASILCSPREQLEYGCRHLAQKIKQYGREQGIAAYNSGSPRFSGGKLVNRSYVDDVLRYARLF